MSLNIDIEQTLVGHSSEQALEHPLKTRRLGLVLGLCILVLIGFWGSTFYLQVVRGEHYQKVAVVNQIESRPLIAPRGAIYDRFFDTLAENTVLDDTYYTRTYNQPLATAHLVGYVDGDGLPKTGLELEYDQYLSGQDGFINIEQDSSGQGERVLAKQEPAVGQSLVLHLDAGLQDFIYSILPHGKKSGVVVIDPQTGGVMSLVSKPGFDSNLFTGGISSQDYRKIVEDPLEPLFNRVINGLYPPGSTIKIFLAAAGLAESLVDPYQYQETPEKLIVRHQYDPNIVYVFPDWKDHGRINLFQALAQSSNVYFYRLGEALGWKNFSSYLKKFGFGQLPDLDFPDEAGGFIPERGSLGDLYHSSIGQGEVKVTVMQMAVGTAALATGKLYQPQLVDRVLDQDNNVVKEILPQIVNRNFITDEVRKLVLKGMQYSNWGDDNLPVTIAGKTGTAQFSPSSKTYHTWFTSFSTPKGTEETTKPDIVLTVLVEEGESGSATALPIAQKIYQWYYKP